MSLKKNTGALRVVLTWTAAALSWPAGAQSPIAVDLRLNGDFEGYPVRFAAQLSPMADGSWRTLWGEWPNRLEVEPPFEEFQVSRKVGSAGDLGPVQRLLHGVVPDTGFGSVFLTQADADHFAILFGQAGGNPNALHGIIYDADGRRTRRLRNIQEGGIAAIVPREWSMWTLLTYSTGPYFWEVLDSQGNLVFGPRQLDRGTERGICPFGFSATLQGDGAAVWSVQANPNRNTGDVRARFFTATGRLGPEFPVNLDPGTAICPEVAMLPGGREAWVLYRDSEAFFPPRSDLHIQRVSFAGQRIGREILVAGGFDAAHVGPKIASDRFGNFVVAWSQLTFRPLICGVAGRLYRADGRPVGPPFAFSTDADQCGGGQQIAFADNGTFAAVWQVTRNAGRSDVYFARFSASPADEPCLVRAGRLLCDTGRTGDLPEIDQEVTTDPIETVLMGDVDGDGRADPCSASGLRLLCDLDHRGAPFEWERALPSSGASVRGTPLLGDVDGDGKADPCLWAEGVLRCRTGFGISKESFGEPADTPLLGDLDGDRRADLCVRRGAQFLCDTAHDGGKPELRIAFGQSTDLPLLGDFDGDGRADPCVLRNRRLLCDTKHNGGLAEGRLTLATQPGDRPLLANLDGL